MVPTPSGNVLAFDFGLRYIGVACGETLISSSRALSTLPAKNGKPRWFEIDKLMNEFRPVGLVVGLPLHMDGRESDMSLASRQFAEKLVNKYRLPTYLQDERLTSNAAEEEGWDHQSANNHSVAARIILDSWHQTEHKLRVDSAG